MNGERMVGFGSKQAWLAVRDGDPAAVTSALVLRDLGPVPWRSGIDLAYLTDDRLVLTPVLPGTAGTGWLLVTGRWLLRPDADVDVAGLSAALGTEVQFFATYRVTELHRWQRAADGELVRSFGYLGQAGEITDWRGDPDEAEAAIGLPAAPDEPVDVLLSEDEVMRLARAWSVAPTDLAGQPAPGPLRAAATPRGR